MGLRTIHLIGLIAWVMVMWDQSLLVETASDQEDNKASGVSRFRLPPDISIPLPYVYPEYVDPREQTTEAASTTEDNRAEETTSVSDIILENVRQTMLVLTPMKDFVSIMHKNNTINSTVQKKNRHVTSTMKIIMSNDNYDEPIAKQMINSKPVDEMKRPFGKRPNRFGDRLRTSTTHFMNENFIKATTTPTTQIPTCKNDTNGTASTSFNNNLSICRQSSPTKSLSANTHINGTTNGDNVALRRRPASRMREVVIRRLRPNVENARTTHRSVRRMRVKNAQSNTAMQRKKSEN